MAQTSQAAVPSSTDPTQFGLVREPAEPVVEVATEFWLDRDRTSGDLSCVVAEGLLRSGAATAGSSSSTTMKTGGGKRLASADEAWGGCANWMEEEMTWVSDASAWYDVGALVTDAPPPQLPVASEECCLASDAFGLDCYSLS